MDTVTAVMLTLATGAFFGALHVVGGPDHMAALVPLSVGKRWKAAFLGGRWGIGHSAGVVFIGLIVVILKERMGLSDPAEWEASHVGKIVGEWGERVVGLTLIIIGVLCIRRAIKTDIHAHEHVHGDSPHTHVHAHNGKVHSHSHERMAFAAGILHGMAGTGHFLGIIPAVALPGVAGPVLYLGGFAAGTIIAMAGFAALIGTSTSFAAAHAPRIIKVMMWTTALLAIGIGLVWIVFPLIGWELPDIDFGIEAPKDIGGAPR